jgi:uncharacterized membrane protein YidH (DUF202 family)
MTERVRPQRRRVEWDDGAASERTVLAWERTALANAAVAALILRAGILGRHLALAIPITVLLILAGIAEWLLARKIYRQHDRPLTHGAVLHERAILTVGAITLIAAAGSIVLTLGE